MMRWNYNDGGRLAAGFKGKAGDCVCRSIAIATGMPYADVYEILAKERGSQRRSPDGKKKSASANNGINTNRAWFKKLMTDLGFKWVPTMGIGTGCKVHLRGGELPSGRIIASVSKHFVAVINGVINDTYDCSRNGTRCVYGYWIMQS